MVQSVDPWLDGDIFLWRRPKTHLIHALEIARAKIKGGFDTHDGEVENVQQFLNTRGLSLKAFQDYPDMRNRFWRSLKEMPYLPQSQREIDEVRCSSIREYLIEYDGF